MRNIDVNPGKECNVHREHSGILVGPIQESKKPGGGLARGQISLEHHHVCGSNFSLY